MKLPGLVCWYGGKGRIAERIMPLIPHTRVYVEPYGGAASILMRRKVAEVEVYNDLRSELVNLMRVLQDRKQCKELYRRLKYTPYSLDEFRRALACESADPVDRAWSFFVRQNQGFSGKADTEGDWGRALVATGRMATTCNRFIGRVRRLRAQADRVRQVQIENRDALDVIRFWDSDDTTFYLDPPYTAGSRAKGAADVYDHECDDGHHAALLALLPTLTGCVVLSGYRSPEYDALGWDRTDFATVCHAAGRVRGSTLRGAGSATAHAARIESVWRNSRAVELCAGRWLF